MLRSAEAAADTSHLQRLLGEQLAHISLPAPVLYLDLRSLETQKLNDKTASLLAIEQVAGDSLQQMQERLGARLGEQQVVRMRLCADHRPERMQEWKAASAVAHPATVGATASRTGEQNEFNKSTPYPTWLLATPLRLAVRDQCPQYPGPLSLLAGPQRLEAAWWGGTDCALRDYFLARSEQFGLLWIYRERLTAQAGGDGADSKWYLHGLFA